MTNGWHVGKFGDVLEPVSRPVRVESDKVYRNLGVQWYAKGLFVREEKPGYNIKATELYQVEVGDLVYNRLFAWKGSFAIAEEDTAGGFVSGEFPCFHVDANRADPKYLHLYLSQEKIWQEIERISTGQTSISRLRLKEPVFLGMEIPLPPLTEQRRIVAHIESLARRVNEAQRLREEADIEANVLAFATARKIISELDYKIIELGELVDESRNGIQTGPFGAQLGSSDFTETGHPVITIGNVQYSGLETAKLKFISTEKAKQLSRFLVQEGDILFARMGTVGRCCVVPKEAEGWIFNYHLIRVALDKSKVEPRFIHWLIRASQDIENKLEEKIRGATREGVNSKIVASLPCRVPPLDEQRRIVTYLDSLQAKVNALRELQSASGEELSALMPSILDKAFKGEL